MKPSYKSIHSFIPLFTLILLALALPQFAHAQKDKSAPAPAPKAAPAPRPAAQAPHPAAQAPHPAANNAPRNAPNAAQNSANTPHPGTTPNSNTRTATGTNARTATGTNTRKTAGTNTGTTAGTNTRTPTGVNTRTTAGTNTRTTTGTNSRTTTGANTRTATGAGAGKTGTGTATAGRGAGAGAGAGKTNAAGARTAATTQKLPNGGTKTVRANGSSVERNRSGRVSTVTTSKGATAKMDAHGRVASIHTAKGTTVNRGPHGERRVEHVGKNGTRVVSYGHGRGYAEHRYSRGGHEYARRTYYRGGHYYGRAYRGYYYHGYGYYHYYPGYYYGPAYYGWAYNPWASPVAYSWGWYGSPWYQPYGYYFAPYPVYPSAAFWLTDYMVAATLQASAEAAAEGKNESGRPKFVLASAHFNNDPDENPTVLTPEVKQMIAEEVKAQLAADKAAAAAQGSGGGNSGGGDEVPPSLDPKHRVFLVSAAIAPALGDGTCALTAGDVIKRTEDTPDGDNTVSTVVLASKKEDCEVGSAPRVATTDLEEMHDQFRQQLEDGLKSLGENQGKGGIPKGPAPTTKPNPEGQVDPDPDVAEELKQADAEGDDAEKEVTAEASSDDGSADAGTAEAPPAPQGDGSAVQVGQSMNDVVKAMGMPKQIMNQGTAQVWVYNDMKVTIQNGKVVDVQQ